jgi:DNA repair protein SbcC/Rad50
MKPLQLTMQAFGPYAGTEVIDFRTLESRTMFVISGKTGAGKTTIFDGISYAIYGKASGEDRNPAELRSQFAREELVTEVELLFRLRSKKYYIWRSPQQEKKKARGDGYTTINARAELYEVAEDGEKNLLAANVRDVDEKVNQLIQLDANQFRQILMIPQGEFRKLLTSDSKDKEQILQKLFHTKLYQVIQDNFKKEADELKKSVEDAIERRTRELLKINYEDNEELKELLLENPLRDRAIMEILPQHMEQMKGKLKELETNYMLQQQKRDDIQKQKVEAENLLEQFKLKETLSLEKSKLDNQKEQIAEEKKKIELAHKALRLVQQDEYCHKLNKELKGLESDLAELTNNTTTLSKQLDNAKEKLETEKANEEQRTAATKKVNQLESIQQDVYSYSDFQKEVTALEQKNLKKQSEFEQAITKLQQVKETLTHKEAELEKYENAQNELFTLEKNISAEKDQLSILQDIQQTVTNRNNTTKKLMEITTKYDQSSKIKVDAKETLEFLESKRSKGQAAILAKQLADQKSCPVCGSTHHPHPAEETDSIPSEEDLKVAKVKLSEYEMHEIEIHQKMVEVQAKLQTYNDQLDQLVMKTNGLSENIDLDQIELVIFSQKDTIKKLEGSIEDKQKEVQKHNKLKEELKLEKVAKEKLENSSHVLQQEYQQIREGFIEKQSTLQRLQETIPENMRTKQQFDLLLSNAREKDTQLKRHFEVAQQHFHDIQNQYAVKESQKKLKQEQVVKIEEEMKKERERFIALLSEQGFEHYRAFQEAKLSDNEIQQKEEIVQRFGEELRSVTDRLTDVEKNLRDKEKPDINKINEAFTQISESLVQLNDEVNQCRNKINENNQVFDKVQQLNESMAELEQKYQIVGHLAEVARGQNVNRITFERYVLASFLEDILQVANERLIKMTSGRYQLIRKKERSKGNVQSGLELLVFDQYTGQERHVKTLSGGESFKASLALALGLADVVQQYAGGVSLETMFIDEGFGTLDPESLDHAIEALMDIQSSGRLVGIISHVPELKERIDARLEVISTQQGSTTEFQFLA